jgi:hypothetical protein
MIKLRDGSSTVDGRLTRLKQFDVRSKAFPVGDVVGGKKPRTYTWRCSERLDQGQEGACVGFAWAHELVARPVVVSGVDAVFARERVYWEAQKVDQWAGGSYPGAKPFYEGTSVLAGAKVVRGLGYMKEYRWAFGLNDLILAVGFCGPVVLGIPWYEGMFNTDKRGYLHISGDVAGGHAIACIGVNLKNKFFRLHNSWGKDWGKDGEALIGWSDMDRLLHEGGEACVPIGRRLGPK